MSNITTDQLVQREVYYCVSTLVSELAKLPQYQDDLMPVLVQDDYINAALENGWKEGKPETAEIEALEYCADNDIEPHQTEAYEHWIVSGWLADKLEAQGEMVLRDFLGLTIWGRSTTGQAIAQDYVIEKIHAELVKAA